MQDGEKADLRTQMLGIAGDGLQGLGAGLKQDFVDRLLVRQRQLVQLFRNGEYDMKIFHRQQFCLPLCQPFAPLQILALWAVAVTRS